MTETRVVITLKKSKFRWGDNKTSFKTGAYDTNKEHETQITILLY